MTQQTGDRTRHSVWAGQQGHFQGMRWQRRGNVIDIVPDKPAPEPLWKKVLFGFQMTVLLIPLTIAAVIGFYLVTGVRAVAGGIILVLFVVSMSWGIIEAVRSRLSGRARQAAPAGTAGGTAIGLARENEGRGR
ncbi:MAG: hypothetical protein Q4F72_05730 [Desulfovibrionaceae bacterium]|nr:hypothetical protein [Desulfovibrionaceae bacterium]